LIKGASRKMKDFQNRRPADLVENLSDEALKKELNGLL
jgi:hypothetical protein